MYILHEDARVEHNIESVDHACITVKCTWNFNILFELNVPCSSLDDGLSWPPFAPESQFLGGAVYHVAAWFLLLHILALSRTAAYSLPLLNSLSTASG